MFSKCTRCDSLFTSGYDIDLLWIQIYCCKLNELYKDKIFFSRFCLIFTTSNFFQINVIDLNYINLLPRVFLLYDDSPSSFWGGQ